MNDDFDDPFPIVEPNLVDSTVNKIKTHQHKIQNVDCIIYNVKLVTTH